jgi:glycine/D-amino acid oxidase-like deaminating enzyme
VQSTADVVIIGAGVIGCSTAYHLARVGITDVLVVEMDQVGSGSSGKSASMLSRQFCAEQTVVAVVGMLAGWAMRIEPPEPSNSGKKSAQKRR